MAFEVVLVQSQGSIGLSNGKGKGGGCRPVCERLIGCGLGGGAKGSRYFRDFGVGGSSRYEWNAGCGWGARSGGCDQVKVEFNPVGLAANECESTVWAIARAHIRGSGVDAL